MTDLPTPKFKVGQTVWMPKPTSTQKSMPCPDCLGTRKWKVITPAGSELEAECLRCCGYSFRDNIKPLTYAEFTPSVQTLTICGMEVSTDPFYGTDDRVQYRCAETWGNGGGTLYRESQLHAYEEEAMSVARADCDERNAKRLAQPDVIEELKIGNLKLLDALVVKAQSAIYDSWWAYRHLRDSLKEVILGEDGEELPDERVDKADLLSNIRFQLSYEAKHRSPHDMMDLFEAVQDGDLVRAQEETRKINVIMLHEFEAARAPETEGVEYRGADAD